LNLSHPPRLNWVASVDEAATALKRTPFDLIIIMAQASEFPYSEVYNKLRKSSPSIPIVRLSHRGPGQEISDTSMDVPFVPDRTFMWSGDTKLLLATIKSIEDQLNVKQDTELAAIRVIIFIEDSPDYLSSLLPALYQELVTQTQAVMEQGLNQEHRMLAMRARPKILLADSFETGMELFETFEPYVLGVISDVRFPRNGKLDGEAGIRLLKKVHERRFDIPLLLVSSEPENSIKAETIPAEFVDKNSPTLHEEVGSFFLNKLGFGPFVFETRNSPDTAPVNNLRDLVNSLRDLPDQVFYNHWIRNDFSRWLFTRAETLLATEIRGVTADDFQSDLTRMRQYLYQKFHDRRMQRQRGVLVDFETETFDVESEILKIGDGSLGGKARGLSFFSAWLYQQPALRESFPQVDIYIPQTLVLTTECFECFIDDNNLTSLVNQDLANEVIADHFLNGKFSSELKSKLKTFLRHARHPIAVRSSSLLEDAKFRAYAGLYKTYMLPNNSTDLEYRLDQLIKSIKLVYASTYYREPKAFSRRVGNRIEEEQMAVIIQKMAGDRYNQYFYPALSGVAQSHNFYPFSRLTPEDGVATIALGLGKAVTEGEKSLRFSPRHPEIMPQRSSVDDTLRNSQRFFYALNLETADQRLELDDDATLIKRQVSEATDEYPVKALSGTYSPQEHRIRESATGDGFPVMTFASILKYNLVPLAQMLKAILASGQEGMGCPVEIEFSVSLANQKDRKPQMAILQIRPMGAHEDSMTVNIDLSEISRYFCISHQALGNTINETMFDIVYVKPDTFDPGKTLEIAKEISLLNASLNETGRKYLLIGPGRWGSADRWLGIPVSWGDICGVGAIIETTHPLINAEASQGSHFFHNITTLGINYLNVNDLKKDHLDWAWLTGLPIAHETEFVAHVTNSRPFTMKVDGRRSVGVLYKQSGKHHE
ncbi:MAG: PEP/pyruvate-binding domain-containing protein, partial [Desulforhopalus sp.]